MRDTRKELLALLTGFAGQQNTLVIPRPFIDFCDGDHLTALLLSQIIYWQDRSDNDDFAKSYDDWQAELSMSRYQVKRSIKKLEKLGVSTSVKKSKYYQGAPTVHYSVNMTKLQDALLRYVRNLQIESEETSQSLDMQETNTSIYRDYTETTAEIGDTSQNGTASIDDIHHSGVARANEVNSIVSLVNNSTSTDGMTLQDIANVYPYSISEIRIMCQQANKDGLIAFDGVTEKAYRLTDYSKPIVNFEDLKRPDEWTFTPKHSTKQDDIKDAVIVAFGWDANKLTDNEHGLAGKAAKQLSQAGVYADEVSALYEYCQRFDNITPMALCNHVNNWRHGQKNIITSVEANRYRKEV